MRSLLCTLALALSAAAALALAAAPAAAQAPPAQAPPAQPAPATQPAGQPAPPAQPEAAPATQPEPEATPAAQPEPPPPEAPPAEPIVTAPAAADVWTFAVAPRIGATIPTSKLGVMVVGGLEIDYALPVLDRRLVVALDLSLTRPSHDGSVNDPRVGGAQDYTIDETELKVGIDILFRLFPPGHTLIPFVGLGPVLQLLKSTESTTFAPGENTAQNTELGLELMGGVDWRLGPGYLLGDVRVVYSDLDHLLTGDSNAGNVTVAAGYRVVF